MGMPNVEVMEIPATVTTGKEVNASDLVMGYEYVHGTAAYTAELQGSVSGKVWESIADLDADKQGEIPAYYNSVRVNTTVEGAVGTARLIYRGKS